MKISVPISIGELFDKISILQIKLEKIENKNKLTNVKKEQKELSKIADMIPINDKYWYDLLLVNEKLWNVEDRLRKMEADGLFDDEFIHLARRVYHLNDERSEIKKEINEKYGSDIMEEKMYVNYKKDDEEVN